MYISLKWVQNLIGLKNIKLAVLCEKLTLAGFEIERIDKQYILDRIDYILDVSLTANRSDIFNIKGFTRELLSIFFKEEILSKMEEADINLVKLSIFHKKHLQVKSSVWEHFLQKRSFYLNKLKVDNNLIFEACSTFISLESNLLEIKPSPLWLQKYLTSSNVIPVNNILDTINFITLETGYPFFACDLNKLKKYLNADEFSFSIRYASVQQDFEVEPNKIIKLHANNLLLFINNKPISILSLLTLKDIEIDQSTINILIYGGLFDSVQIRKSSQVLGIRTEQSISLEKNLNLNSLEQAYIRLNILFGVQGINFSNDGLVKIHTIDTLNKPSLLNYIENKRPKLSLKYKEVNNILGSSKVLTKTNIRNILKALHFQILEEKEDRCDVYIPFSREFDLERDVDLIEEIVRISGFNSFHSVFPDLKKIGKFSKLEKLKRLLRKNLLDLGFNEVLHYSMNTNYSIVQLELKNPIIPESDSFRISLLNQLILKSSLNKKQKNNAFEAFEIGRVYSVSESGNISESELISGIFGGNLYHSDWNEDDKSINWFEAKGLIEFVFNVLGISTVWSKLQDSDMNILHTSRSAQLFVNRQIVGVFGQIHPMLAKTNCLPDETYLFEFNLEILESLWQPKQIYTYNPYSLFPFSLVDLACIKKNSVSFQEVESKIYEIGGPLLESINLFDYYSGSPIPTGYHSLGFKLKFRSFNRTLTNEEVDNIIKKITNSLELNFDIIIRK